MTISKLILRVDSYSIIILLSEICLHWSIENIKFCLVLIEQKQFVAENITKRFFLGTLIIDKTNYNLQIEKNEIIYCTFIIGTYTKLTTIRTISIDNVGWTNWLHNSYFNLKGFLKIIKCIVISVVR